MLCQVARRRLLIRRSGQPTASQHPLRKKTLRWGSSVYGGFFRAMTRQEVLLENRSWILGMTEVHCEK